jgi:hypothetical protein
MTKIQRHAIRTCLFIAAIAGAVVPLGASTPFSRYRNLALGDSVATVVERLQIETPNVKVLFEQPSLVQELTWHPYRFISGVAVTPDPLSEVVLTFHLGKLVRIAATYDRDRIQGLTDADLQELVSVVYGLSMLPSRSNAAVGRRTIGSWGDADALVVLWGDEYPRRSGLTITSPAGAAALDEAAIIGARLVADDAPRRERLRLAVAAAAVIDREAQIRLENKAKFKP